MHHPVMTERPELEIYRVHTITYHINKSIIFTGETDGHPSMAISQLPALNYKDAMKMYGSLCQSVGSQQMTTAHKDEIPNRIIEITLYHTTLPLLKATFLTRE